MSYTIVQIFDNSVSIKCNVTHDTTYYDLQYIISPRNEPVNSSTLLVGDILVKDYQNYMHLVEYSTNRVYPTSQYLINEYPESWFISYFPYIRPFEVSENNLNLVLGTKIIEYTFLHNTQKLFIEIRNIAPDLEEILNFFLGIKKEGFFHKSMADALLHTEHVIAIAGHCMHSKNRDIRALASLLNIKLTILQMPEYTINLINPNGEIEFTLLFIKNKYEILYTEQEKYIMEYPSSLKFFERFDKTQQDGYNIQEMKETFDGSVKKFEAYKQILAKLTQNLIARVPDSANDIIERLKISKFFSLEMSSLVNNLICRVCKRASKILTLECNHKVCETCFVQTVSDATHGFFVLNQLEVQANILCPACNCQISEVFIKQNLWDYDNYAKAAEDRINLICYNCDIEGKLDMFLTECRCACRLCTGNQIRNGSLQCEKCLHPYSKEVYKMFMGFKYNCEGCFNEKYLVKDFESKLCKHLYCLNCIEQCEDQVCFENCPKFNLDAGEFKSLFIVSCTYCPESYKNIFPKSIAYWNSKPCQCKICLPCMLSDKYKTNDFEYCPICQLPFDESFSKLLQKEYTEYLVLKGKIIDCDICYNSKPYEDYFFLISCECTVCKVCINSQIKESLSDINFVSKAGCCPSCSNEIFPEQIQYLFSPDDWNKYNTFLFLLKFGEIIPCPKCREHFNPGMSRCVTCPNKDCNFKFCKQCEEVYHKEGDCEEVFIQGRIEILKNEEGGVTQCPKCRLPYIKDPKNCEHATCINSACGIEFCFLCACIRSPTMEHGTHYHRPNCKFFTVYDGKDDKIKEKCSECKKLGVLCKPPKLLKIPRLVDKDEIE